MTVLVVGNRGDSDLGLFSDLLSERFGRIEVIYRENSENWSIPGRIDAVVHLGSDWSVYWSENGQHVKSEIELMRFFDQSKFPVFGICFGAQLMSVAFGGTVVRSATPEIGLKEVYASDAAEPLAGRWVQWHFDTFSAPKSFDILAWNDAGVQAISRNQLVGVQFHPEVDAEIAGRWVSTITKDESLDCAVDFESLLFELRESDSKMADSARALVNWFAERRASGDIK